MNTLYDFYWRRRATSASLRRAVVVSMVLHVLLLAGAAVWMRQQTPMAIGTIYEVQFGSNVPLAAASKGGAVGEESEVLSPPPKAEPAPEPEPEPEPEPPKEEPPKPPEPKPEPPPPPPPPKETPKVVKKEEKPKEEKPKPPEKKEASEKKPKPDEKKKPDSKKDGKKSDKQVVASADQPEKENQSDKPVTGYGKGQKGDQIGQPKGDPNLPPGPGVNMGEGLPTILTTWGSLVQIKVQRLWEIPTSVLFAGTKNEVTISFWVNHEGYVLGEPEIVKSVGDPELGVSAVKAIKAAVPLPQLPESYGEPEVQVVCTFVPTE